MQHFSLQNNKIRQLPWMLWMLAMLYLCRDSMYSIAVFGFLQSYLAQFAFFAAGAVGLLWINKCSFKSLLLDRRALFAVCICVIFLLPMVCKRDWQLMYFSVIFVILYSILLSFWTDMKHLSHLFVAAMGLLSIGSVLCTYGLRYLADGGFAVPPIILNNDIRFYNYGVSTVFIDILKWRSLGIFREPGVYQYFLILALYLNNDVCCWNSQRVLWGLNLLLGFTMLTTLAFGGIAEMALLIAVLFFEKGWYRNRRAQIITAAAVLFVVAAYNVIHWLDGPLWGEIWMLKHKFSMGGESVTDRFGSIVVNTQLFLQSPLFGDKIAKVLYHPAIENNTSSTTIIMAIFGITASLLHIGSWLVLTWKKDRSLLYGMAYALILAMAFNTENLIADIFLWLFPVMAVCEKVLHCFEVKV